MKADASHQRRLADLARVDATLNQLAHRRAHLPEQKELDTLTSERNTAREAAARKGIEVEDVDRAISKLESDIGAVRKRRERDSELVSGGSLGHKQVSEVEHELGTLSRRQDELETEQLELMERRDAMQADIDHSGATASDLDGRIDEARRSLEVALGDLDDTEGAARREREQIVSELPGDLLELYSELLETRGVGAGVFGGGRCSACSMELDRSTVSRVQSAPEDEVMRCPECEAILVRGVTPA